MITRHEPCAIRLFAVLLSVAAFTVTVRPAAAQDDERRRVAVIDDLMWAVNANGENVTWHDANEYCETLELEGYRDWRLPTLFEIETLYDPAAEARGRVRPPIALDDCCVWSSTNLVDLPARAKGVLPEPLNELTEYYWGFLFSGGIRYYGFAPFADAQALCARDTGDT